MDYPTETKHGFAVKPPPTRGEAGRYFHEEMWLMFINWPSGGQSPPIVFIGSHGQAELYKKEWYRYIRSRGLKVGMGGILITLQIAATPVTWAGWIYSRVEEEEA